MKEGLNYIELMALVRELSDLEGARVENVYHPSRDEVTLNLYKGERKVLKINLPRAVYLTEYKQENPMFPSHFSMFLRKYLKGSWLVGITQAKFERVIKFNFRKGDEIFTLVVELFSKGNVILCNKDMKILIPLKSQSWKDRVIRAGQEYLLPPPRVPVDELDFPSFKNLLLSSGKDEVVKSLATSLGIGGTYAEEVCAVSEVDKHKNPTELSDETIQILFDNFLKLIERAQSGDIEPNVVFENNIPIDVLPFILQIYGDYKKRIFSTYSEALDFFFTNKSVSSASKEVDTGVLKEIMKQEMILKQHKDYLKQLEEKSKTYKAQAEFIYQHLGELDDIFNVIKNAREKNISWDEIISKINQKKSEGNKEARLVKQILPSEGIIVIGYTPEIRLDFTKNVTDNANLLYERAKKMENKVDGVMKAINDVERKIKVLREKKELEKPELPKKVVKKEREWYEKFHWFFTTGGKLVIGGKDATQNEILIKKHLSQNDIVFHADVYGSPFVVMKDGSDSTDEDKKEAAIFTLCHSRAWQNKHIESVYWVLPQQVSKKAPSGEYIGRGAFMIYGKKNYIKDLELRYAVGIQLNPLRVISGPVENVRRKARYYAVLIPGDYSKDEISKRIRKFLIDVSMEKDKPIVEQVSVEDIKEHALKDSQIFGVVE